MKFVTCNCLTKTPDPKYHKENCPVWMEDRIKKLEIIVKKLGDASAKIHNELNIIQPYLSIWKQYGDLIEECRYPK